mmetsp:Transcript_24583/g.38146  ORF Transcript_24583/g.38146 Transcript_24583/m.38146 type:complete len:110 (+) Transcript_24583:208-537(+)
MKRELQHLGFEEGFATSFISGSFSGVLALSVLVPFDLLKCRAQMNKDSNMNYSKEFKHIMKTQGIKGLYRGFWATFLRDLPGYGVYFSSFYTLKTYLPYLLNKDRMSDS